MQEKSMRLIVWRLAIGCLLLASPGSCSSKRQPDVLIVVFFDVSGSTVSVRSRYKTEFEEILKEARNDARFVVVMGDRITANTEATLKLPVKARFEPSRGWFGNPLKEKKQREKESQNALKSLDVMLQQSEPASDIMSAFRCAGKVFGNYKKTKHKLLIIFSDMIEQSGIYNFATLKLNQRNIQQIIQQEQRDGRIPDLKGVQIWISGFAAAERGGLTPKKIKAIEDFWVAYLQAANADVDRAQMSQSLINFELPSPAP